MSAYEASFAALADPTRRAIFERLAERPQAVGELARDLPVSRPAVSQHLKVLKDAGLVIDRPLGTRRIYQLDPDGLAELRAYFDSFWTDALSAFRAEAERREEMTTPTTEPTVRKTLVVEAPAARAFEVFTDPIGAWWPLGTHARSTELAETAILQGREGGRASRRRRDADEADWGRVLVWEPPRRVVFTWEITQPATEVEVRFTPEGDATRVDLEHRGWERLGSEGEQRRQSYDEGWSYVLSRYEEAVGR